jgi:hypothetical protein
MGGLHEMLVEDEIVFCGLMLLFGILAGAAARYIASMGKRRIA